MSITIFLQPLLLVGLLAAPQEHLEPLPLYNGEATNGENWGWLHAESRGGGALEKDGSARVIPFENEAGHAAEHFDGSVVALNAGATAVTTVEDRAGMPIQLDAGSTYELTWNQGALAVDPPPIVAISILDRRLKEVPGTRTVKVVQATGAKGWKRQSTRFKIPEGSDAEWGHMIAFQNLAKPRRPEQSIALIDKVSLARVTADESGFIPLFDGTSLEGWTGAVKGYRVRDGAIELDVESNAWGNLYTKDEFDDFILRFEFKLTPGANNGVGIRAPLGGDAAYEGMEIQVLESTHPKYAGLKPWQYHGSIYGIAPAIRGYQFAPGSWNSEEIMVDGRRVRVTLNGRVILDVDLDEAAKDGTLSGRDHPGLARTGGHLGFCGHGDEVAFRNIRIKKLGTEDQNRSSQ